MATIVQPAGHARNRHVPGYALLPLAAEGAAIGPAQDEDGLAPVAAVMREMATAIAADGVLVAWHDRDRAPVLLFAGGACAEERHTRDEITDRALRAATGIDPAMPGQWRALEDASTGGLLTTSIAAHGGTVTITSLFRRIGIAARSPARDAATRWLPIVQAVSRLWAGRLRALTRLRGLTAAVNTSDVGILLVDRDGQCVFANATAEAMIAAGDGLRRNGGLVAGRRLADTLRLQAAIEHVLGAGEPAGPGDAPVVALTREGRRPLLAAIMSGETGPAGQGGESAVIYVFDPEQDLRRVVEPACKLYGLSPVEARLTCLLADGLSLNAAAAAMHVREQTARSYLKQIFLKTDTNRQAELVWLMLKSAVRTAPGCRTHYV